MVEAKAASFLAFQTESKHPPQSQLRRV